MGEWVVKTAADYANHIAAIQQIAERKVAAATGNVIVAVINHAVAVIGTAMELAPKKTGYMASQAFIRVNGDYIKRPGHDAETVSLDSFYDVDHATIEYGWEGPTVGGKYNLAFIHEIHVEFVHEHGYAKFFQTANERHGPDLMPDLQRAVADGLKAGG